jgi:thymidylate synthase
MKKTCVEMNTLDKTYTDLLQDILDNGIQKGDRTGTGTLSVFGRQIRHRMSDGFPLLTTKKMAWKSIVTELLWFLRGDTNIKFLVDNDCHIWNGDAYKNYESKKSKWEIGRIGEIPKLSQEEFVNKIKTDDEFAKKWGDLGPVYGKQWRRWTKKKMYLSTDGSYEKIFDEMDQTVIDQIAILINDLKTNPDSRRLMVSAWNPAELDQMVLPPCHYGFQVYTRELSLEERCNEYIKRHPKETNDGVLNYKWIGDNLCTHKDYDKWNIPTRAISLMWNQRSVDTFLGLPFNIASYGLLLEIIAKAVNMVPDELIGNLGDVHLYSNHIEQAKEQIGRELSLEERNQIGNFNYTMCDDSLIYPTMEDDRKKYKEIFDKHNIPTRTREPYPLPTLKHMKTEAFYKSLSEDVSLVTHLDNTDFVIENYQSHPSIKAPLSN